MGLLSPIILILFGTVDRLRDQLSMGDTIASQFIGHDLPGFALVTPDQSLEESLSCSPISLCLEININHFAILIYCTPEVMLLAVDLYKNFIDEKCVTIATVLSLQSSGVEITEFYAPEADRFAADSDASLSQKIFNITVAQVEAIIEPDCVADDVQWESVTFISSHNPILAGLAS